MTINKIIREIMSNQKVSLANMAKLINKERGNDISARLATRNMSFDKAIEMLDVLNYKIVVVPKDETIEGYEVSPTSSPRGEFNLDELLNS